MNKQPTRSNRSVLLRFIKATFMAGLLPALVLMASLQTSQGGSATWNLNPTSGDWNTATNWTPATVPNGLSNTASFDFSNLTQISVAGFVIVRGIEFTPAATAPFTTTVRATTLAFNNILAISRDGIVNNSGVTQNFVAEGNELGYYGFIYFQDGATAGNNTAFTTFGGIVAGGSGGTIYFQDTTSATNAIITNNGTSASGAYSGHTEFGDSSTAANSTLIANGSDNGEAGGVIGFYDTATGGTARVEVFGNGNLDISYRDLPGVTLGSIEGDGIVFLGQDNLTVGTNNLATMFSGIIQDGGVAGGVGGSLTKTGSGKLTLSGPNTYTGGTTINAGTVYITNRRGSGTGSGVVQINAGKLGGTGKIVGGVTVGDGSAPEAYLTPGVAASRPAILTIRNTVTFQADGTLHFGYKSNGTGDKIVVRGVTINAGAELFFGPIDTGTLTVGTVFSVIDNTATTPIAGTFANINDGGTVTVGSNTFQANYEGGDGNDLTLTVVP